MRTGIRISTTLAAALVCIGIVGHGSEASAQSPLEDTRMGCILKYDGKYHFMNGRTRNEPRPAVPNGAKRVMGACDAASPFGISAAYYAGKAARELGLYAPLSPDATLSKSQRHSGHGQPPSYVYERYSGLPTIFINNTAGVDMHGVGYATAFDSLDNFYIVVLENGQLKATHTNASAFVVNRRGTMAGQVITPPFGVQAAIFRGNSVELIPPEPGETGGFSAAIDDRDRVLVASTNDRGFSHFYIYDHGKKTQIPLPFDVLGQDVLFFWALNDDSFIYTRNDIGHKFDLRTMKDATLEPLLGDTNTWAMGLSPDGEVLAYSFVPGGVEHIGVYRRNGKFELYFEEGTPTVPTVSNSIAFNDRNEIVISSVAQPPEEVGNAYLIPKPGVRLNLADVTQGLPDTGNFDSAVAINKRGDIAGLTNTAEAYVLHPSKQDQNDR